MSKHLNPMKTGFSFLLTISSLAIGLTMTSCVTPYDAYGSTTVTTYNPGYRVNSLPSGYRTEIIGGSTYYYNNGAYYRSRRGGYEVVEAPRSSRYYREYDRYRNRDQRPDRDQRSRRDYRRDNVNVITRLPDGYRTVNVRGRTYYLHRGQYYDRRGNGYTVVDRPF